MDQTSRHQCKKHYSMYCFLIMIASKGVSEVRMSAHLGWVGRRFERHPPLADVDAWRQRPMPRAPFPGAAIASPQTYVSQLSDHW